MTWWAFVGGAAALALGLAFGRRLPAIRGARTCSAALAALLFVLPVAVHGFRHWTPRVHDRREALSPELVARSSASCRRARS